MQVSNELSEVSVTMPERNARISVTVEDYASYLESAKRCPMGSGMACAKAVLGAMAPYGIGLSRLVSDDCDFYDWLMASWGRDIFDGSCGDSAPDEVSK